MKTKTKMIAMVAIAIVLCSVFLVALPAIAADQTTQEVSASTITTSSEDDYVLGIYGNANEDDTIDMRDLTYVKLIFFGKKPETELADAKYDGKINPLDFIQIKLIIVGKEKELTVIDGADRVVTVKKPIERIIPFSSYVTEVMRSLKGPMDKIVGVPFYVSNDEAFFPEFTDFPRLGGWKDIDYEKIVELQPDVFFLHSSSHYDELADKVGSLVPGVTVVRISCAGSGCMPEVYNDWVRLLGYIIDREDEAEALLDFQKECLNLIKKGVETLSEDEKPRVFYTYPSYFPGTYYTANRLSRTHSVIVNAGGINIAADIGTEVSSSPTIDPEWVIEPDPEIILGSVSYTIGYQMGKPTEAEMVALRDKIMSQPGWGHIAAVKSDKVYLIEGRLFSSPHNFIGIAYMAKLFHPDFFEDLDPQAIHQEYLTRFQGVDFDVHEDGIFVYPPLT